MGFISETKPLTSGRTYSCKVADIYRGGDDEDRAAIDEHMAMDTRDMSSEAIAKWLGVDGRTVRKHRERNCVCFRG